MRLPYNVKNYVDFGGCCAPQHPPLDYSICKIRHPTQPQSITAKGTFK